MPTFGRAEQISSALEKGNPAIGHDGTNLHMSKTRKTISFCCQLWCAYSYMNLYKMQI